MVMVLSKKTYPRVTEAFYTTKQDKIGLGLTVANRIVAEHLGELHISSEKRYWNENRHHSPKEVWKY